MKILINASNLKIGGGLQVAHSVINHILNQPAISHDFVFVVSTELELFLFDQIKNVRDKFITYDVPAMVHTSLLGKNKFLDQIVNNFKIDRVFTVFGPSYWRPIVPHTTGYAKPQYIYTDSPFFKQLNFAARLKLSLKRKLHLYSFKNHTDQLISENEDVSVKLRSMMPGKKIHTVSNYYHQIFDDPSKWLPSSGLDNCDDFKILVLASNYPHKNLNLIPDVIKKLKSKFENFSFKFVLTIDEKEFKDKGSEILDHILFMGKIGIAQCPDLYRNSDLLFLPTLLECFTATYPEAMKMEVPILTSDLGFARGICENAAYYVDPLDPDQISDSIYKLHRDKELVNRLIVHGRQRLLKFDTHGDRVRKYINIIEA
ncbi:MAG: glycosyltransferase [Nonlabens sp.]